MTDVLVRESWIFDMRTDLLHYSMHFTSLFLYLLIMLTRQIKCQCSKESVEMVKSVTRELSKVQKNDSRLYTPTLDDYKNCSKSTLTCFALEVEVLIVEIQSVAKSPFQRLPKILKTLTYKLQDKMKTCPDCEFYQEQGSKIFLEKLLNVLQWMNAEESCASKKNKRHL